MQSNALKVPGCHFYNNTIALQCNPFVFTGFLAQSVQELWLIIGLPATIVAGTGIKGLSVTSEQICCDKMLK